MLGVLNKDVRRHPARPRSAEDDRTKFLKPRRRRGMRARRTLFLLVSYGWPS